MSKSKGGFSLIEVLISIALLGVLMVPISSGLLMSYRINEKSDRILQANLAVSSAAETLMAVGGTNLADLNQTLGENGFSETVLIESDSFTDLSGGFEFEIKSKTEESVSVTIFVRDKGVPGS